MAIRPLDLPSAAGLEYGKGDVRHFAVGDALDVPGISNPGRHLAERDNLVAEKLNEAINVLNNQEQSIPLPLPRTIVPPNDEAVIANYRIPPGFESRVLNAAIGSTPASTDIELNIYFASGFGNSTGTSVVSTSTEFTGGVQFYQQGEFIITLKNKGATTLEIAASALFTLRPIGAEGTLLVGTVIEGPKGAPGQRGAPGPPGSPGSGGAGSPGMVWKGSWMNGNPYNPNEVVSFSLYGSITSSYIARVAHVAASGVNDPQTDSTVTWNPVAIGGSSGTGVPGPAGPSGGAALFNYAIVNGTLVTGSDWLGLAINDYNSGNSTPSTTYTNLTLNQYYVQDGTASPNGLTFLYGVFRQAFRGSGTITLPKTAYGAKVDYTNTHIQVLATANGTTLVEDVDVGPQVRTITAVPVGTDSYVVKVLNNDPVRVAITVFGAQPTS